MLVMFEIIRICLFLGLYDSLRHIENMFSLTNFLEIDSVRKRLGISGFLVKQIIIIKKTKTNFSYCCPSGHITVTV